LQAVGALIERAAFKGKFAVLKRRGPPCSDTIQVVACPK
jgi:hypothetical protein